MSGKMCRLCFGKKSKVIGILTTKGVKLNIASAIRMHLLDEVNRRFRI